MKLHLFRYECKSCGNIFKSPELTGNPYGEFLLKSKNGQLAYLNAVNSKTFKEVSSLLKLNKSTIGMKNTECAKILHRIFGVACDSTPDGNAYGIMQKTACSNCGQINIDYWGPTNPPEYIEEYVKPVTHKKWNNLSDAEKKLIIDESINIYLSGKQ